MREEIYFRNVATFITIVAEILLVFEASWKFLTIVANVLTIVAEW